MTIWTCKRYWLYVKNPYIIILQINNNHKEWIMISSFIQCNLVKAYNILGKLRNLPLIQKFIGWYQVCSEIMDVTFYRLQRNLHFIFHLRYFDHIAATGGVVAVIGLFPQIITLWTIDSSKIEGFNVNGYFLFIHAQLVYVLVLLKAGQKRSFFVNCFVWFLQLITVGSYYIRLP